MSAGLTNPPAHADPASLTPAVPPAYKKKKGGNKSVSRTRKEICQKVTCICRNSALECQARCRVPVLSGLKLPYAHDFLPFEKPTTAFWSDTSDTSRQNRQNSTDGVARFHRPALPHIAAKLRPLHALTLLPCHLAVEAVGNAALSDRQGVIIRQRIKHRHPLVNSKGVKTDHRDCKTRNMDLSDRSHGATVATKK